MVTVTLAVRRSAEGRAVVWGRLEVSAGWVQELEGAGARQDSQLPGWEPLGRFSRMSQ